MAKEETGSIQEKRRGERILVPVKSTALFSNGSGAMDKIYIRDISVVGMLLCDYFGSAKNYPINSSIYNINIDIPSSDSSPDNGTRFLIDKGTVVRSFIDQSTNVLCFGVSFSCDSNYVKEKIECLVNNAQSNCN
jgi:hypothetical protein